MTEQKEQDTASLGSEWKEGDGLGKGDDIGSPHQSAHRSSPSEVSFEVVREKEDVEHTRDLAEAGGRSVDERVDVENGQNGIGARKAAPDEKSHANDLSSIPDGGAMAWLQVVGSFILFMNTWGITNTFGVYQTHYELSLLRGSSPSSISWIGSIQAFLLTFVGFLTGPAYDAGYFRQLLLVGSFLVVFGHFMLSLCTRYGQVLLAQALCVGVGTGCLFVPCVSVLSTYFHRRLALAMGLAASGSSIGGVLYPLLLRNLIPHLGFPWAVRILAFLKLTLFLLPLLLMRVRIHPSRTRAIFDPSAFHTPPFPLFVLGGLLSFLGIYAPYFYIQLFSLRRAIVPPTLATYLLAILNAGSTLGRILPNALADRIGPLNTIAPVALLTGALSFALLGVSSRAAIIVFVLLYGFASGALMSLPPTVVVSLTPDRSRTGTRMGMCLMCVGVGVLVGTPIAGSVLTRYGFEEVWILAGSVGVVGAVVMWLARGFAKGWGFCVRA